MKERVTKLEAGRRELDAAIRMLFANEDQIAVRAIASAANQIIRDLSDKMPSNERYLQFTDWIAEGHEKEFWAHFNKSASFLKHADRDPLATHEFDPRETDFLILFACNWYKGLGCELSLEMNTFLKWFLVCNPNLVRKNVDIDVAFPGFQDLAKTLSVAERKDQIEVGRLLLEGLSRRSTSGTGKRLPQDD